MHDSRTQISFSVEELEVFGDIHFVTNGDKIVRSHKAADGRDLLGFLRHDKIVISSSLGEYLVLFPLQPQVCPSYWG